MKRAFASSLALLFLLSFAIPAQADTNEKRTWQDETVYFMMVDRFNNLDSTNDQGVNVKDPRAYFGGDLKGITAKLDYIQSMGFTAIRLTPIFQTEPGDYQGKKVTDFYKVDPRFGTLSDLKTLVKEAHKRHMKVILDFVTNHTSSRHPWVNDPAKKDWYHEKWEISDWNNPRQIETGWLNGLPDLAQENPEVKRYLIDAAKWWIKETDIDGYYLDDARYVPKSFWQGFANEVKAVKKDFYLLGGIDSNDPRYIADYEKDGIDGFLDYPFYNEASKVLSNVNQSLAPLYRVWKNNVSYYDHPYLLGTFLDNDRTVRFTRLALENKQNPITRMKLSLAYLFSTPGVPIVYYGTEIVLDGGKAPDNHRLMNFRTDDEVVNYIKKLGELRGQLPSLRRGDFTLLYEKKGMAVFKRTYKGETAVIAINNTNKTQKVHLTNAQLAPGKELRGLLSGDLVRSSKNGYNLISDRETAEIYVLAKKTGLNIPFIAALIAVYVLFGLFLYYAKKRAKRSR
ncbi:alpha-amylase family glycosyl hydrolase [Anoxybacillus rupiensis]|uniref:alpha-amylase n=1 Tax=Anoxybacteroides rupiense TaxID=311460 RepID=A0ABT5W7A1_9BACL|nr:MULTISPECIES: alpha-amylase family glycosyl hydrolase [Anoxybacillus]MDE8565205.1 alpha-amylase family glycosyl hydrolase [Anoxybacillus rupiensis]